MTAFKNSYGISQGKITAQNDIRPEKQKKKNKSSGIWYFLLQKKDYTRTATRRFPSYDMGNPFTHYRNGISGNIITLSPCLSGKSNFFSSWFERPKRYGLIGRRRQPVQKEEGRKTLECSAATGCFVKFTETEKYVRHHNRREACLFSISRRLMPAFRCGGVALMGSLSLQRRRCASWRGATVITARTVALPSPRTKVADRKSVV